MDATDVVIDRDFPAKLSRSDEARRPGLSFLPSQGDGGTAV